MAITPYEILRLIFWKVRLLGICCWATKCWLIYVPSWIYVEEIENLIRREIQYEYTIGEVEIKLNTLGFPPKSFLREVKWMTVLYKPVTSFLCNSGINWFLTRKFMSSLATVQYIALTLKLSQWNSWDDNILLHNFSTTKVVYLDKSLVLKFLWEVSLTVSQKFKIFFAFSNP